MAGEILKEILSWIGWMALLVAVMSLPLAVYLWRHAGQGRERRGRSAGQEATPPPRCAHRGTSP